MSDPCETCDDPGYGCPTCAHFDSHVREVAGYQRTIRELNVRILHHQERAEKAEQARAAAEAEVAVLRGELTRLEFAIWTTCPECDQNAALSRAAHQATTPEPTETDHG